MSFLLVWFNVYLAYFKLSSTRVSLYHYYLFICWLRWDYFLRKSRTRAILASILVGYYLPVRGPSPSSLSTRHRTHL